MITSYDTFVQYFRELADSHVNINSFQVGNSERILNRQRSDIDYPILWLEVPDVSIFQLGGYKARYSSRLLVLKDSAADDWDGEDASLNICLKIMFEILTKMEEDADDGEFEFVMSDASIQPKTKWSADDDHGWALDFSIVGQIDQCVNPDNFQ